MGTSIEEKHRSLEPVRQLFFADQPLEQHVGTRPEMATIDPASPVEAESDWSRLFMLALARQRQGDEDGARQALFRVANMANVETRVQLWAWKGLQDLGVQPDPASAREVLGVVIEIAMEQGLDTLAVFADGSARFINQAGNAMIWDAHTQQSDAIVRQILAIAQPLAEGLPLRRRDPGGLPSNLEMSHHFPTRSGTTIGSKVYGEEPSPPALGRLLVAGSEMVDFFTLEDLKRNGDQAGLVRYYDHKIGRQPNFAPFYNNRGNARYAQGNIEGSLADFSQAIKLKAYYAEAYSNRGVAYHSKGDHKRALADFSQATRINPGYAPAYNNRSLVYKSQGQYDKSIAECDKAIQLQPNYIEAYRNRGMAYFLMNEPRKALADLEKSVELGGNADNQYQIVVRDARMQLAVPPNLLKKGHHADERGHPTCPEKRSKGCV
jgi:tetratricopeptide (TPR) repeat protein